MVINFMKLSILYFSLIVLFYSCDKENYKKEFYTDGTLKAKIQINDKGVFNGLYKEFYKNEQIKIEGIINNGLKLGWWNTYDSLGHVLSKREYLILRDSIYKNQTIFYDREGNIRNDLSSFYKIELPDTITLGKNIGRIYYNSNFLKTKEKFLHIIINNQYSDFEIKKDTFVEGFDNTRFGIFAHKTGRKKIKGTIIEKLIYVTEINKDSSELIIKNHKKYCEKMVYVKDTLE